MKSTGTLNINKTTELYEKLSVDELRLKHLRLEKAQQKDRNVLEQNLLPGKTAGTIFLIISVAAFLGMILYPLDTTEFSYNLSNFNGAVLGMLFLVAMFFGSSAYQILSGKQKRKVSEAIERREIKMEAIRNLLHKKEDTQRQ